MVVFSEKEKFLLYVDFTTMSPIDTRRRSFVIVYEVDGTTRYTVYWIVSCINKHLVTRTLFFTLDFWLRYPVFLFLVWE